MHTPHEVILDYMTLSENEGQVGYPLLKKACELSWYKLFKKTKESIVRKWVEVIDGKVTPPRSVEKLLGVMVVDHCGDLKALFEDNVKSILIKPKKKCKCTACDTEDCLCPTIQDPIVQTDVIIEGVTHTNKTATRVLKNGKIVEESFIWVASFNPNGSFKEAVEVPSQITKCQLDILPCGCPANTEENVTLLSNCGCLNECYAPYMRERYPALYNPFGYYKVDDTTKQISVFNSEGRRSNLTQVELVFQSNGADILVKDYARPALIALLDTTRKQYSPSFDRNDRDESRRNWNREEYEMIVELNPIPFEWAVRVADATKKGPYYGRPHSDFVSYTTTAPCCPTQPSQSVTNIINSTSPNGRGLLKLVVDAGAGNPVSGLNTFQHNSLIDLGDLGTPQGRVEFKIEKIDMKNWGNSPDFTFDKDAGITTFTGDYVWQTGDAVIFDLNQ